MKRIFLFTLLVTGITFYSCKKEEPDTEAQSAVDNSICEGEFTRIGPVVNDYAMKKQGIKSACPSVSADTIIKLMTLDYGTSGCQDTDGKSRKGKILAKFNGKWSAVGTIVVIKLQNYQVGDVYYNCDSIVIIRNSANSFSCNVVGGKSWNVSWNLEWAATRIMTQTAGVGDTIASNDEFEFTGNTNGKNRDGKMYTTSISVPIQKKTSCNWIDKGRLDLTPEGHATRTVDYGIGACDNDATLTINGNVYTFKLD